MKKKINKQKIDWEKRYYDFQKRLFKGIIREGKKDMKNEMIVRQKQIKFFEKILKNIEE